MGYRSDIKCVMYVPEAVTFGVLLEYLKTNVHNNWDDKDSTVWTEFEDDLSVNMDRQMIFFEGNGYKWYESYPDVAAFMAALDKCEEIGGGYQYVRVGGESSDIEERSAGVEVPDVYIYVRATTQWGGRTDFLTT